MTEFRFEMWATTRPDDPYYVTNWDRRITNWDRRTKITVVAVDKPAAIRAADTALGSAGQHRHWVFEVLSVTDHRIPVEDAS